MTTTTKTTPNPPTSSKDLPEGNPLFEAWRSCHGDRPYDWHNQYPPGGWPDRKSVKDSVDREINAWMLRKKMCAEYSFAVPSPEVLDLIAQYSPIVEMGAGTGYWAGLLRRQGAEVEAFDVLLKDYDHWFPEGGFGGVRRGNVRSVIRYADRTLMLCWPPYDTSFAADVLVRYSMAGGRRILYIGEGSGGCTGDARFHRLLHNGDPNEYYCNDSWKDDHDCERDHAGEPRYGWERVNTHVIPQWYGINDYLFVYER